MVFIGVAFGFFGNTLNVDPHVSGTLIATSTFIIAAILSVIALWLKPVYLGSFNAVAMITLVIIATTMVFPRFDATDTMRPWQMALSEIVPEDQTIFMYRPTRWVEYSLQFYRFNRVRTIESPEDLIRITETHRRVLCIVGDKALGEVSNVPTVDVEIVHTIGGHTAFWAWQTD